MYLIIFTTSRARHCNWTSIGPLSNVYRTTIEPHHTRSLSSFLIHMCSLLHSFPTLLTIFFTYFSHPCFLSLRCVLCFTLRHARC